MKYGEAVRAIFGDHPLTEEKPMEETKKILDLRLPQNTHGDHIEFYDDGTLSINGFGTAEMTKDQARQLCIALLSYSTDGKLRWPLSWEEM